jgi:coenzyme F420-reducing hydrogenase alpha subunit
MNLRKRLECKHPIGPVSARRSPKRRAAFWYHRYALSETGLILAAKIVPPTSQNQKRIEDDLKEYASHLAAWPVEEVTWKCEQAVRNYDPCISCATHFLKVERT